MIKTNKLKLGVAGGALVASLFLGTLGADEETFLILPVEEMRASYWEKSNELPTTVQYTDDADAFIISFDQGKLPVKLKSQTKYTSEEIATIKDQEHGPFFARKELERNQTTVVEDDNFAPE